MLPERGCSCRGDFQQAAKKDPTRRQSGDSLLTRGKNPLDIDPRPSVRATIMALKNAARTAAQAQEKVQDITAKEER